MSGAPKVIGVVGAGTMGSGIAQLGALSGARTLLFDADAAAVERALERIPQHLDRGAERGRWSADEAAAARERLEGAGALEDLAGCELVIEAAGAECFAGDPDVVGTLRYALDGVTILLWLLGTASGPADKVAALHGSRLRMMLEKTTDTTVRGVVYEARGSVGAAVLAAGMEEMRHARATNEIPYALLETGRDDRERWVREARAAVDALLADRRAPSGSSR